MEERTALLEERLLKTSPEFQQEYRDNLDMSWVYHDSAIEVEEAALAVKPLGAAGTIVTVC